MSRSHVGGREGAGYAPALMSEPARRRPTRRLVILAVVGLLVVWGAVAGWAALGAKSGLETARTSVRAAQTSLAEADLPATREHVATARAGVDRASRRVGNPAFALLRAVPVVGRSADVVTEVVRAGSASVDVLEAAVDRAGELVTDEGRLALPLKQTADGRLDLDAIRELGTALDDLPLDELRDAQDRLATSPATWIPGTVREARADALDLVGGALGTLERAQAAVATLPGFLGADGPRSYFLAMQNPSEIRGTGGLIGFYAVLTADDGGFEMSDPTVYNALNHDEEGNRDLTPVPAPDGFQDRYGHVQAAGFWANVNVDPDLPTTAQVALDLYAARRGGQQLDGLVAIDPNGLGQVMAAIGPVPLPEEAIAGSDPGSIPNPVPPARIAEVTMVDAYNAFGGPTPDRKEFLGLFARAVFEQLFTTSWNAIAVGRGAGEAAGDRHLQVYSRDEDEEAAFTALGVAGAMPTSADPGDPDVIGVSANNAAGNKQDVHVAHRIGVDVALDAPASDQGGTVRRRATVDVALENPLPTSGMDIYIIGAHPTDVTSKGKEFLWSSPAGLNRTWFTVWSPDSDEMRAARDRDGEPLTVWTNEIHGHRAVDWFLETSSETTNSFAVDLEGPAELRRGGVELVYDLTLWHQSKSIPDHWDATIAAPAGWTVAAVEVTGGGSGAGMGVGGEKVPLTAEVVDGGAGAHVTGTGHERRPRRGAVHARAVGAVHRLARLPRLLTRPAGRVARRPRDGSRPGATLRSDPCRTHRTILG